MKLKYIFDLLATICFWIPSIYLLFAICVEYGGDMWKEYVYKDQIALTIIGCSVAVGIFFFFLSIFFTKGNEVRDGMLFFLMNLSLPVGVLLFLVYFFKILPYLANN